MNSKTFLENSDYLEYVCLLLRLHELEIQGEEDSEQAEALRDKMDRPWYRLSEQEMYFLGILSADLQMLTGEETFRSVPREQRTREWLAPTLEEADKGQNWLRLLELLRTGPDFLTSDQLAYLRGSAYLD